ncbi:NAD(P)-binding protein [Rickenella mellea]|uniref:NAD(P)-binding protein n=1 Tax=Rickenella mellea TaxID=50990 RepID=A0A4Y7PK28_9AGAM|nr:NAD(P)-binding protein [Rickenella mellea]
MSTKRVAIITGAAQGIGKAIALRLAADGFDIGLNDLPSEEQVQKLKAVSDQIQALGRKACIVAADVSIESAVEGMLKDVMSTPVEQWDEIQGVNLRGVFLCFKHAAKQMLEQNRGGRLIGGGSLGGFSGLPMGSAYAASKAGMRALTHSAARELGPSGITVNTYAPGVVVTDLTLRNYGAEFLEQQKGSCAIGDHGTPEDVAALVSFLASKESRFITGESSDNFNSLNRTDIMIDGGRLCT